MFIHTLRRFEGILFPLSGKNVAGQRALIGREARHYWDRGVARISRVVMCCRPPPAMAQAVEYGRTVRFGRSRMSWTFGVFLLLSYERDLLSELIRGANRPRGGVMMVQIRHDDMDWRLDGLQLFLEARNSSG